MATTYDERDTDERAVLLPCDLRAERAVLGCILIERGALAQVGFLVPEDFFKESNRDVYRAMLHLDSRHMSLDDVTIAHELQRMGYSRDAAYAALAGLYNSVPDSYRAKHYADVVLETSIQRQAIHADGENAGMAYHRESAEAVVEDMEQRAFALRQRLQGGDAPRLSIADDLRHALDDMEARGKGEMPTGVLTDYHGLDDLTGGLHNANLIIVAARPGQGKTSLMLSMGYQQARKGIPVGIFSAEMAREELIERLIAIDSGIPLEVIRSGQLSDEQWTDASQAVARLNDMPILIDDTPAIAISALRSRARQMVSEHHVQVIYADYLQLFTPAAPTEGRRRVESRAQEVGEMAKSLKHLARELKVPVVTLAQLSRAVEQRADKTPVLSDLRESGDIENNADIVMFIARDESDDARKNVADLVIAKHRNGPKGVVSLYFQAAQTYYRNLTTMD